MEVKTLSNASIPVPFAKITAKEPENKEFTLCKIWAQGVGKNRNYSYMSEESIKDALPTLPYVPVVGHLLQKFDENGEPCGYYFGSHDYEVTDDLKLRAKTVPFGVVIDDSFAFEDVEEFGKTVRYLTCNAYLWTGRYPELKEAVYSEDTWFNESMEITNVQYRPLEEDSNYAEFLTWNYSALCILGKSDDPEYHTEPCYISAHIEPMKFDLGTSEFNQTMKELREQLSFCFGKKQMEGGTILTQQERDEIFAKFSLTIEQIDFEVTDDMTAEQLTEKLEAFAAAHQSAAKPVMFSMTYRCKEDKLRKLCNSLCSYKQDASGQVTEELYCYMMDFDDEVVYYSASLYQPDSYTQKYFRRAYAVDEQNGASFTGEPEEVFERWLTAAEIQKMDNDKKQLEALTQFKKDTEKEAYQKKVTSMLEKFSDVAGLQEYAAIKQEAENSEEYDTANFEMRLFALRGMQVRTESKPQSSAVHVTIEQTETDDDGYGGLVSRAHNRRK